jgi:hypothetical protein
MVIAVPRDHPNQEGINSVVHSLWRTTERSIWPVPQPQPAPLPPGDIGSRRRHRSGTPRARAVVRPSRRPGGEAGAGGRPRGSIDRSLPGLG